MVAFAFLFYPSIAIRTKDIARYKVILPVYQRLREWSALMLPPSIIKQITVKRIYFTIILIYNNISLMNLIRKLLMRSYSQSIRINRQQYFANCCYYKRNITMEQQPLPTEPPFFSIAPMIDISNTHFRYFIRLITKKSIVYTEMLHHDAVLHNHSFLLPFSPEEHPIVLQLGGSDPQRLAEAAILGQQYGYNQINLNVGCPSPRVQKGSFGACLMKEATLVKECMQAMAKAVTIKCTVKCRLGVDEFDSYQFLVNFVKQVSGNGKGLIKHFVIHARKAFLKGLNPAQNRSIPPLIYERVYLLKKDFPTLSFEINGGIKSVTTAKQIVTANNLQGCMVGRLAYENPFELMTADQIFYSHPHYHTIYSTDAIARRQIMTRYADYIQKLQKQEIKDQFGHIIRKPNPSVLVKPIINFYNGQKFSGRYRQFLSDLVKLKQGPLHLIIRRAADMMWQNSLKKKKSQQKNEQTEEQETKVNIDLVKVQVTETSKQINKINQHQNDKQ